MSNVSALACRSAGWTEIERSDALAAYAILDTPREEDFDDLAKIASEVCKTPIAVVNLVDTERQFFKAEIGLGVRETPLATSFCGHAILAEDMLIVPDATKDPRFLDNPLVTGEAGLRFYAGALLKTPSGIPIGTMCVLDFEPRQLDEYQVRTLKLLARQAMAQFEMRRRIVWQEKVLARALDAEREKAILARIVEQSADFIGMADPSGRAFYLNDAARQMIGLTGADISKTEIVDFFADEDRETVRDVVMPAVMSEGYWEGELRFRNFQTGIITPVLYNIFPLHDDRDELVGYGTVTKDVTAQKAEEDRRADIAAEISHRMKNTLAMVQAIVSQTFRNAKTLEEGKSAISGRLAALARAQDIMKGTVAAATPIRDIVETALAPHRTGDGRFTLEGGNFDLTAQQALGLSLALHELSTNAAKYGALSNTDGRVAISWSKADDAIFHLEWSETGGPTVSPPIRSGFGTRLVGQVVASYFDGTASLEFEPEGVRFHLTGGQADDATTTQSETV